VKIGKRKSIPVLFNIRPDLRVEIFLVLFHDPRSLNSERTVDINRYLPKSSRAAQLVEGIYQFLGTVDRKSWYDYCAPADYAGFLHDSFQVRQHVGNIAVQTVYICRFTNDIISLWKRFGCTQNTVIGPAYVSGKGKFYIAPTLFDVQLHRST